MQKYKLGFRRIQLHFTRWAILPYGVLTDEELYFDFASSYKQKICQWWTKAEHLSVQLNVIAPEGHVWERFIESNKHTAYIPEIIQNVTPLKHIFKKIRPFQTSVSKMLFQKVSFCELCHWRTHCSQTVKHWVH